MIRFKNYYWAGLIILPMLVLIYCGTPKSNYTPSFPEAGVVYQQACISCHEGSDNVGPVLRGKKLSPAKVKRVVQKGKGKMPKFPNIAEPLLSDLAKYVSELR